MNLESTNSVLTFAGGFLAFLAALLPIIRFMLKKAYEFPDKQLILQGVLAIISLLFIIAGAALNYLTTHKTISIFMLFGYMATSTLGFIINTRPITRTQIYFEGIMPSYIFLLMLILHLINQKPAS